MKTHAMEKIKVPPIPMNVKICEPGRKEELTLIRLSAVAKAAIDSTINPIARSVSEALASLTFCLELRLWVCHTIPACDREGYSQA